MNLSELKDSNGTSLQSYVDSLVEKAGEKDIAVHIIFAGREKQQLHVVSGVPPEKLGTLFARLSRQLKHRKRA